MHRDNVRGRWHRAIKTKTMLRNEFERQYHFNGLMSAQIKASQVTANLIFVVSFYFYRTVHIRLCICFSAFLILDTLSSSLV